ncbi:MAG: hypothetical protein QNJ38_14025 [Prochloraceae cyanobacterium]|nr:hypothetical protein [Prochloraceae cyanobacterium]
MKATIYISTNNKPITIITELGNILASEVKFTSTEMILKKSDEGGAVIEVEDFYSLIIDGQTADTLNFKPSKVSKKDLKTGQKVSMTNGCTATINYIGHKPKDRHRNKLTYIELVDFNPTLALFPENKLWLSIDEAVDTHIKAIID